MFEGDLGKYLVASYGTVSEADCGKVPIADCSTVYVTVYGELQIAN